jgi:hypothetical protein
MPGSQITRPGWISFTRPMFCSASRSRRERHGLAVIAGARAPRRDRAIMGVAGAQDLDHLGLGFRGSPRNRPDRWSISRLQDRRIPEEIAAFRADGGVSFLDIEMRKGGLGGGDIGCWILVRSPSGGRARRSRAACGRWRARRAARCGPLAGGRKARSSSRRQITRSADAPGAATGRVEAAGGGGIGQEATPPSRRIGMVEMADPRRLAHHLQHVHVAIGVERIAGVVGGEADADAARLHLVDQRDAPPARRAAGVRSCR